MELKNYVSPRWHRMNDSTNWSSGLWTGFVGSVGKCFSNTYSSVLDANICVSVCVCVRCKNVLFYKNIKSIIGLLLIVETENSIVISLRSPFRIRSPKNDLEHNDPNLTIRPISSVTQLELNWKKLTRQFECGIPIIRFSSSFDALFHFLVRENLWLLLDLEPSFVFGVA